VPIDRELLEILACPSDDHAPLREDWVDGREVLVCTVCRSSFPVEDGIPVLLRDDATPGPNGLGVPADPA
jgi:uncharacterized protein YbaR (Trm112 family)